jgi:hypothetical protein
MDMDMIIRSTTSLKELKNQFNHRFSMLKLEFFKKGDKKPVIEDITIADIRLSGHDGHIEIHSLLTASELERSFREIFGIDLQVFRKSGNVWLQTTTTDHLTLGELNNLGESMSKEIDLKSDDYDYREQE